MDKIINYYMNYNEEERLTKTNVNSLEYFTTINVLDSIISSNDSIAELGAGTGTYSFYFSEKNHDVIALDIVPKHIQIMEQKKEQKKLKNIEILLGNATELKTIPDNSIDVVLCLGPLYHLLESSEQQKCLKECYRILKPNGKLAVSYINKHYVLSSLLFNNTALLKSNIIDEIIINGKISSKLDILKDYFDLYFFSPDEIEKLLFNNYFEKIIHVGTDGIARLFQNSLNTLTLEEFNQYKEYHLNNCKNYSLLGYSNHGLFIGKKIPMF